MNNQTILAIAHAPDIQKVMKWAIEDIRVFIRTNSELVKQFNITADAIDENIMSALESILRIARESEDMGGEEEEKEKDITASSCSKCVRPVPCDHKDIVRFDHNTKGWWCNNHKLDDGDIACVFNEWHPTQHACTKCGQCPFEKEVTHLMRIKALLPGDLTLKLFVTLLRTCPEFAESSMSAELKTEIGVDVSGGEGMWMIANRIDMLVAEEEQRKK